MIRSRDGASDPSGGRRPSTAWRTAVNFVSDSASSRPSRLPKARIGMLDPAGELDPLVAHQRVAQELYLRRRRAGDEQDANLLTHHPDRGGRDVVVLR